MLSVCPLIMSTGRGEISPTQRAGSSGASASTTFQQFLEAAGGVRVALYASDADALPDVANGSLDGAMTAATTASTEQAAGAQIATAGAGFFFQPQAFATRPGEADFVAVLDGALKTMRGSGVLRTSSRKWYHGLDVSARPSAAVPEFSKALAMLKAGTYPLR